MSEFKKYAERVDALAKETREKLKQADNELARAEDARSRTPMKNGTTPEYRAKAAQAEAWYQAAVAKRNDLRAVLSDNVETQIKSIRREMEQAIDDAFAADPAAIDAQTMTLLESGILRPAEYGRLLDKAIVENNPTMARLIGAAAEKHAAKIAERYGNSDRVVREYRRVEFDSRRFGGAVYLENINVLSETLNRCMRNPALWSRWEELTEEIIEKGF